MAKRAPGAPVAAFFLCVVFFGAGGLRADDNHPVISVTAPAYGSPIFGDTTLDIVAPGMDPVTVRCWQPEPNGPGADSTVGQVSPGADGRGSIIFPADKYPHGPVTLHLSGRAAAGPDDYYLQLYNRGGVPVQEGIPPTSPPAAAGLALAFADDFDRPLSISSTDPHATYYDHKPPNGIQDFSSIPFTGHESPNDPFERIDTYLRIRADAKKNSSGLISSIKNDGSGFKVEPPCYFECRLLAPNAKGTWPAFWLMTDYMADKVKGQEGPADEIDVVEAYGGAGEKEPNLPGGYMITPHAWNQGEAGHAIEKEAGSSLPHPVMMKDFGIPASWWQAFHTYGCKITSEDTIYYCDNIEVGRHKTMPYSKTHPFFFMINLATGAGWPVDLSRSGGKADMYIDYVRVYGSPPHP